MILMIVGAGIRPGDARCSSSRAAVRCGVRHKGAERGAWAPEDIADILVKLRSMHKAERPAMGVRGGHWAYENHA